MCGCWRFDWFFFQPQLLILKKTQKNQGTSAHILHVKLFQGGLKTAKKTHTQVHVPVDVFILDEATRFVICPSFRMPDVQPTAGLTSSSDAADLVRMDCHCGARQKLLGLSWLAKKMISYGPTKWKY